MTKTKYVFKSSPRRLQKEQHVLGLPFRSVRFWLFWLFLVIPLWKFLLASQMLTSFFIIHSRPYFRLYKSKKYFRIFSKSIQYLSFSQYLPIFIWQIFYIANNILLHYIFQWNIMILTNIGGVTKVRAYFSKIHRCFYWLGNRFHIPAQ